MGTIVLIVNKSWNEIVKTLTDATASSRQVAGQDQLRKLNDVLRAITTMEAEQVEVEHVLIENDPAPAECTLGTYDALV